MVGLLTFVLPGGRSAEVAAAPARLICNRLWDLGIAAGAATAAAKITEALHHHPAFDAEVIFSEREVTPLIEAARADPATWTLLLERADLSTLTAAERERLPEICDELIERLSADGDQKKVAALVEDLERLRKKLRAAG